MRGCAAEADRDRRVGVQNRVRDQLGDPEFGGVLEIPAAEGFQLVNHPDTGGSYRARLRRQL